MQPLRKDIQIMFQDPYASLDPRMTVGNIIAEPMDRMKTCSGSKERLTRIVELMEVCGINKAFINRYPHEFSGGQRQRIGIARALSVNPKLVVCDEPVSALDVSIQAQVINLLNNLKEEMGLTVLFIAHNLSVVKYFSDRIGVMYYGKLVEVARGDDLYEKPLHPYTRSLLSAIPEPNPFTERLRKRIDYDPKTAHDYSKETPRMVEIEPEHFVYCSPAEEAAYKKQLGL